MAHLLDNMIWNAITTGNRTLAVVEDNAGFFRPDIAPFAAMREPGNEGLERLHGILPAGKKIALSWLERIPLDPGKWETVQEMDCCQMLYEVPVDSFLTAESGSIMSLNREHIPEMLELTALTRPGPFLENTILFGNYFGIFLDGRLAAMTGQRMHPVPYMEVSAVCTHPGYRGRGLARTLMLHVMKIILEQSFIPFLHVLSSNTGAIRLYESIGFRLRTKIQIDVIKRL